MRTRLIGLLSLFFIVPVWADLSANGYKKHAKELRDAVWNWDIDAFKNYSIPEEYTNESAVILARHQQIEANSKNKFRTNAFLYAGVNRELYYTKVDRKMIKLNDRKSLLEYSELSFKEEVRSVGFLRSNKLKTVVGARIIKPDGTVAEINIDEDAVAVTEGKKDKEAFKKVAIKGLEVGDILDYFYSEEMELETQNVSPQFFTFIPKYPTLSYSVECVLGENLTVEYRSVNGAPDFERSLDEDKNTVLSFTQTNLKSNDHLNEIRWFSVYRDLPMIRLLILNHASKLIYKPASARKKGVYKNVGYEEILNDKKSYFASWSTKMLWMGDIYKNTNKAIANYKHKNTALSNEELALYIYDAIRFYWPNSYDYPSAKFFMALEKTLKENGIECKIGFTTSRFGPRRDEVVTDYDFTLFLAANHNQQMFFYPAGYKYAGESIAAFEGEPATVVSVLDYKPKSATSIEGIANELIIPSSSFEDNKRIVSTRVVFSEQNPLELKIKRTTISSGEMKDDYLEVLALYEDWDKVMRKRLLIETDFWQDMQSDKKSRNHIDRYKTYFEEQRKEQKELIETEIKEYHSMNSGELIDYSITNIGATIEEPTFEFWVEYKIDGLVKKAGDNFILDAGKLMGTQYIPTEKERNRDWNAYLEAPMLIENEIIIDIPVQYRIEGIENLNRNIDNEYGKFSSTAMIDGNKLKITTAKVYKQNFVPKDDWGILLNMIDVTNDFYSQSVIFTLK